MEAVNAAKVVRRVRQRLEISQEALSRLLNATKGAVQHWERGRNNPDLARLLALRQLCPPGPERKELDALIKQTQAHVAPLPGEKEARAIAAGATVRGGLPPTQPSDNLVLLRREKGRLERQVAKLQATLERRNEQLRILEDLATELQREMAKLRAQQPAKPDVTPTTAP